ncbi:MAG: hypothetical protein B6244_09105 [Candidatus Cloacimonetes bacterium 4572_55]|nr:MAG: hypothetical protein B6244_09105 [Candidatus Cloacimonetes bacterium 4572_55]
MAETAHRRLALALADSEMNKWEILVSQEGLTNVPRNRVKCVVDHRDLKTKRDDLEGYIEYGELELMTETIGEQPVQSYYKFWVRVSWYENNEDTPEFVQLISYFPKKE